MVLPQLFFREDGPWFALDAGQGDITFLHPLPGHETATDWTWSLDRQHVAIVDQVRKRLTTYARDGETLTRTMAPRHLPRRVESHCVALHGSRLFVGDQALWSPSEDGGWTSVPIPSKYHLSGKRIDGLVFDGDTMIAVDDLMFPK